MIQKLKSLLMIAASTVALGTAGAAPVMVFATGAASADVNCNTQQQSLVNGVNNATGAVNNKGCGASVNTNNTVSNLAQDIVNIFSIIVGAAAVIMIIYGGFRYITSGGDSGRVSSAKNTLIYAIIGLIIVALAQLITHFVISTALNQTS